MQESWATKYRKGVDEEISRLEPLAGATGCKQCVPRKVEIRSEVSHIHHDTDLAGHFGAGKTLELIRRKYFWPRLKKDVKIYIRSCPEC